MTRNKHACTLAIVVCGLAALIPLNAQVGDNAVLQWNNAALQAVRDTHPGPPQVARALAMTHTAMFDAWAAYDATAVGTRFGGALRRPASEATNANKTKAVSYAAYNTLIDLFPTEADLFNGLMQTLGFDPADSSSDASTPSGIGNSTARALLTFRHNDGSNQLAGYADYTGYVPRNGPDSITDPNHWQPLRVSDGHGGTVVQTYVAPHWGYVIPFALSAGDQFRPTAVLPVAGSDDYAHQVDELLLYSALLTDQQKMIAEYWADGPASELPPGHWALFSQFVSRRDSHTLDQDIKMFFAVSNAILDASICAWDTKRAYDSVRPITAIHYLRKGKKVLAWGGPFQGTQLINGEDWIPYQADTVVTPPFPEFISGHSIFSAAGAEVLKSFTGSDLFGATVTFKAGSSRFEPGAVPAADVTLSWATFSDAADEAGISRRYGGIHFVDADLTSRALGRLVGAQAWAKALTYFNGTASVY
jgi:hypothetical protein